MKGKLFEGDIALTATQRSALLNPQRNGLVNPNKRWKHGIVPYKFDSEFFPVDIKRIEEALEKLQSTTCIRFVHRRRQRDYVRVTVIQ